MKFYMTLVLHEKVATFSLYNYTTKKNYMNFSYDIEQAKKILPKFTWNGSYYEWLK